MDFEIETLEWDIEQIFKEFGIKYERFAPLSYDVWIAEDAHHASTLYIAHPRKRITILLVLLKSKSDNECPPISETSHIKKEATHFKPDPASRFCFYHMGGSDFTPKQIIAELRVFLRDAVKEERRRRGGDTPGGGGYTWLKEKYR